MSLKLRNIFPFIPVFYEMARDCSGQGYKTEMLLVIWLLTEVILLKLSLLTSARFFVNVPYHNINEKEERQNFSLLSFHCFLSQPFCTNPCHTLSCDRSVLCVGLNKLEARELRSLRGRVTVLALQGVSSVGTARSYPNHLHS